MNTHRLSCPLLCSLVLLGVAGASDVPLYLDASAPTAERVQDLVSRMTLSEKISQLSYDSPGIDRLGIPPYNWANECLHGVVSPGIATVFPQAIGLAAAWNRSLHGEVASAIADEVRGLHNELARQGIYWAHTGLTCWSPNINIFRDPRWGRGQETYGEDPYLTGTLAAEFVHGLQGEDARYLKTIATPKHYAVHSGPEPLRHSMDVAADPFDVADTYLPAFEMAVRSGAESVMCAYNRLQGSPACASEWLLRNTLRESWAFKGYVVSDCGAITDIFATHHAAPTPLDAAALALNVGTDLACGDEYQLIPAAEQQGLVSRARIDEALGRLLTARMRLGMFDPPDSVPYAQIPFSVVDSQAHRDLALRASRESMVLLKNTGNVLPLRKDLTAIAVIGPNARNRDVLLGNYHGTPSFTVNLLEGIRRKVGASVNVEYALGSALTDGIDSTEPALEEQLFHWDGGALVPGLRAEYFVGMDLSGPPVVRIDNLVDFHWRSTSPAPGIPGEGFSARWTGVLIPQTSATYDVGARSDDGSRVYLDGQLIVDQWVDQGAVTRVVPLDLVAGRAHDVRVEFYQNRGDALMRFIATPSGTAQDRIDRAVAMARNADAVVLALGLSPELEGEEMPVQADGFLNGDRTRIELPATQEALVRAIAELQKPTVAVLMNGGALAVASLDALIPGILEAWYPGQQGGDAIADVLFGDYNPGGRLPVTFYQATSQLPPFEDYAMSNRSYRYFTGAPLYPFGFGLSYARFQYRNLKFDKTKMTARDSLRVSVDVTNVGAVEGDEVVEVYVLRRLKTATSTPQPIRALRAFRRLHLAAGEKQRVEFTLTPVDFALVDAQMLTTVPPGFATITVGGKQPGFRGSADAITTEVTSRSISIAP